MDKGKSNDKSTGGGGERDVGDVGEMNKKMRKVLNK